MKLLSIAKALPFLYSSRLLASAQLTRYDIPHGQTVTVECADPGTHCVLTWGCFSDRQFRHPSTVTENIARFIPDVAYEFSGSDDGGFTQPYIAGSNGCDPPERATNCTVTCDSSCMCLTALDEFETSDEDGVQICYEGGAPDQQSPCNVTEVLNDATIPSLDEETTFEAPVDATTVELRCFSVYNECSDFAEFNNLKFVNPEGESFAWGYDITGCDTAPCDLRCDPDCECTVDGADCTILTESPTVSPTLSAATTKSTGVLIVATTIAWFIA
ncbi:MAG: hypothetical protein SGARI_001743 [Bacillariaceae sp.]